MEKKVLYGRKQMFEILSERIVSVTIAPPDGPRKTMRLTLIPEIIAKLDNRPIGFETDREAALFDLHSINAVDIDTNRWETIEVRDIQRLEIP